MFELRQSFSQMVDELVLILSDEGNLLIIEHPQYDRWLLNTIDIDIEETAIDSWQLITYFLADLLGNLKQIVFFGSIVEDEQQSAENKLLFFLMNLLA